MTHEHAPRVGGVPAGPEDDETLPDADSIPTHDEPGQRRRDEEVSDA